MPQSGQGNDGGFPGVVGMTNTLGFMARTAEGITSFIEHMLDRRLLLDREPVSARFVPLAWDPSRAMPERKLKIGW